MRSIAVLILLCNQLSATICFSSVPIFAVSDRNVHELDIQSCFPIQQIKEQCFHRHWSKSTGTGLYLKRRLRNKFSEYRRRNRERSERYDDDDFEQKNKEQKRRQKLLLGAILKNSNSVISKVVNRKNWGENMLGNSQLKKASDKYFSNAIQDEKTSANLKHNLNSRKDNNFVTTATTHTSSDNDQSTIETDPVTQKKEPVSIMGNIESSLFHVANDDLSNSHDKRIHMQVSAVENPAIILDDQSHQSSRRRNTGITESVERKLTGVLYATALIIIANIYSNEGTSSVQNSSSLDPISGALDYLGIPVSMTGLAAIVLGEGFAWIFEEQVMKAYFSIMNFFSSNHYQNVDNSQSVLDHSIIRLNDDYDSIKSETVPSSIKISLDNEPTMMTPEAGKDYDTVEIFADLLKWSFFDALHWPFAAYLTFFFGNQNELLLEHSYMEKACVGTIAGPIALMYADTLRQTFHLGKEVYIRQIEQRNSGTWIVVYITRILSTALLFGLYEYIITEVSL